jgi:hypothetical protein
LTKPWNGRVLSVTGRVLFFVRADTRERAKRISERIFERTIGA